MKSRWRMEGRVCLKGGHCGTSLVCGIRCGTRGNACVRAATRQQSGIMYLSTFKRTSLLPYRRENPSNLSNGRFYQYTEQFSKTGVFGEALMWISFSRRSLLPAGHAKREKAEKIGFFPGVYCVLPTRGRIAQTRQLGNWDTRR